MSLFTCIFYTTIRKQNSLEDFASGSICDYGYLNTGIHILRALTNSSWVQSTWESNYMDHWLGSLPGRVENCPERSDLITKPLQSTQCPYTQSSLELKAHSWANCSPDISKLKSLLSYPGWLDLTKSTTQGCFRVFPQWKFGKGSSTEEDLWADDS